MSEVTAEIVVEAMTIGVVLDNNNLTFTPTATSLSIFTNQAPGVAGSNAELQYNNDGTTGGTTNITYDNINSQLVVASVTDLRIGGGDNGYVLQTDGLGNLGWTAGGGGGGGGNGVPGGANAQIQFNDSGVFGGDPGFVYDKVNNVITADNANIGNIVFTAGVIQTPGTSANITGANVISAATFIGDGGNLTGLPVPNFANYAAIANSVAGANVSGTVANATYAVTAGTANSVAGANVSGTVANATYAVTAGTANAIAVANVSGIGNIATINKDGNGSHVLLGNGIWANYSSGTNFDQFDIIIGNNAGNGQRSSNSIAIGTLAGHITLTGNIDTVAIGNNAGYSNQHSGAIAIGHNAGNVEQAAQTVSIGYAAGSNNQLTESIAIGLFAGTTSQGIRSIGIGSDAGAISQGNYSVALGYYAGRDTQGATAIAIGANAGFTGQGTYSVAIGSMAGRTNQAANTIILNATGANLNQTTANTFTVKPIRGNVANNALYYDTSSGEITYGLIGTVANATYANTAGVANSVAGGNVSGAVANATYAVTAGTANSVAGANVSGYVANANHANIADTAGAVTTNAQPNITSVGTLASITISNNITMGNAVVIGNGALANTDATTHSVTIGYQAGGTSDYGNAVSIGYKAGHNSASSTGVFIGANAGSNITSGGGTGAVAIGANAAVTSNLNVYTVSIGFNAGSTDQNGYSVSVGALSGANLQGSNATAIGYSAGRYTQGTRAVAMGYRAGDNTQGANSIAIGALAGITNQAANTIILNATGANLNQTTANTFTVKPIRGNSTGNALYYDTTTGEITYAPAGTVANATYANTAGSANTANTANAVAVANVSGIGNIATVNLDGNAANILYGNGAFATAPTGGGNGTPGGSNTQIQFNDSTAFGGDANLTFDKVTGNFTTPSLIVNDGNVQHPQVFIAPGGNIDIRTYNPRGNLANVGALELQNRLTLNGNAAITLTSGGPGANTTGSGEGSFGIVSYGRNTDGAGAGAQFNTFRLRGNRDANASVANNDTIGSFNFVAYGNGGYAAANPNFVSKVDTTNYSITANSVPAKFEFSSAGYDTANTAPVKHFVTLDTVGNVTLSAVYGNGVAYANVGSFNGSGAGLSNIAGANVTGNVANATYAVTAGALTGGAATFPIGTIMPKEPVGDGTWLECNGASVSQSTYANLFTDIGHGWIQYTASTSANLLPIVNNSSVQHCIWAGNRWITKASSGAVTQTYYTDGISVSNAGSFTTALTSFKFLNSGTNLLAVADSNTAVQFSTDAGGTWTAATLPSAAAWMYASSGSGKWIGLKNNSRDVIYSGDSGATWATATNALPASAASNFNVSQTSMSWDGTNFNAINLSIAAGTIIPRYYTTDSTGTTGWTEDTSATTYGAAGIMMWNSANLMLAGVSYLRHSTDSGHSFTNVNFVVPTLATPAYTGQWNNAAGVYLHAIEAGGPSVKYTTVSTKGVNVYYAASMGNYTTNPEGSDTRSEVQKSMDPATGNFIGQSGFGGNVKIVLFTPTANLSTQFSLPHIPGSWIKAL